MPIASLKPLRKTAPSRATRKRVMAICPPWKKGGAKGFSTTWAAASAAERVIVTTKPVATKPISARTKS